MIKHFILFIFLLFSLVDNSFSANTWNDSFAKAKEILEKEIYTSDNERKTLYCNAQFYEDKSVDLPIGFTTRKHKARTNRIEWEHVVPVENFGRTFPEWRDGHPLCIDDKGKKFKGRKCAELVSKEYRLMASDLHNLYPAIGAVNASRSNYNFAMLPDEASDFGTCEMKISNRKVEPPEHARGKIARAYIYMEKTYPRYKMSKQQRQLMNAWDKMYPPSEWEVERDRRIAEVQKQAIEFIK